MGLELPVEQFEYPVVEHFKQIFNRWHLLRALPDSVYLVEYFFGIFSLRNLDLGEKIYFLDTLAWLLGFCNVLNFLLS